MINRPEWWSLRLYNGCPDSQMKREWEEDDKLLAKIKEFEPDAHCTYFPMERLFQVHSWGKPLSDFFRDKRSALENALEKQLCAAKS